MTLLHSIDLAASLEVGGAAYALEAHVPLELEAHALQVGDSLTFTVSQLGPSPTAPVVLDAPGGWELRWTWNGATLDQAGGWGPTHDQAVGIAPALGTLSLSQSGNLVASAQPGEPSPGTFVQSILVMSGSGELTFRLAAAPMIQPLAQPVYLPAALQVEAGGAIGHLSGLGVAPEPAGLVGVGVGIVLALLIVARGVRARR